MILLALCSMLLRSSRCTSLLQIHVGAPGIPLPHMESAAATAELLSSPALRGITTPVHTIGGRGFFSEQNQQGQRMRQASKQHIDRLSAPRTWKSMIAGNFFCTDHENDRALKAEKLNKEEDIVHELCIMGVTKFGWAVCLTVFCILTLVVCIPLILALSRRRPPGASLLSSFSSKPQTFQFRPPQNAYGGLHGGGLHGGLPPAGHMSYMATHSQ